MKYGFFPGCSLERSASAYEMSTKAIAQALGIELEEIEDWNCCGATEYFSINKTAAFALVARNLALAADHDGIEDLVAPCSACYLNLNKTNHYMGKFETIEQSTNEALSAGGLHYEPGSINVRHLLDVVVNDIGYEAIAEKLVKPLTGLRVAPYYGCLITRPNFNGNTHDNSEYPIHLDGLLDALDANVINFPLKTHCCGGHMTQISSDTAFELIRRLLKNASDYEADVIVSVCPMCQLNLDAYQPQVNRHFGTDFNIPILYFTQLLGLALGIAPKTLGIGKEIVSASKRLEKVGQESEEIATKAKRKKRDDTSLPMPGM